MRSQRESSCLPRARPACGRHGVDGLEKRLHFRDRGGFLDNDRDLPPEIQADRGERQAADDGDAVVDEENLAVRLEVAQPLGSEYFDLQAGGMARVEQRDEIRVRQLRGGDTTARP